MRHDERVPLAEYSSVSILLRLIGGYRTSDQLGRFY